MAESIKEQVRAFIIENFLFGDTSAGIDDDASLIENDIIDSTGVLELVAFVEERFGVTMADSEIVPANLDSLDRITAFVTAKTGKEASLNA